MSTASVEEKIKLGGEEEKEDQNAEEKRLTGLL